MNRIFFLLLLLVVMSNSAGCSERKSNNIIKHTKQNEQSNTRPTPDNSLVQPTKSEYPSPAMATMPVPVTSQPKVTEALVPKESDVIPTPKEPVAVPTPKDFIYKSNNVPTQEDAAKAFGELDKELSDLEKVLNGLDDIKDETLNFEP